MLVISGTILAVHFNGLKSVVTIFAEALALIFG